MSRHAKRWGLSRKNDGLLAAVIPYSPTSGRMRYAPTVFGEKLTRNDAIHHRIPNESMVNM